MKIIEYRKYDGGFWVRVFGHGLSIIDKVKHAPLFSERYGYRKMFRIGRFGIEYLKPWRR